MLRTSVLPGGRWAMQTPQLLQAMRKSTVSNDITEGDRAAGYCSSRFPGNMYLYIGDAVKFTE